MRLRRKWLAVMMMLGFAFAQIVTAAHACSGLIDISQPTATSAAPDADAMPEGCADMSRTTGSTFNVCEAHCVVGQQVDVHTEAPMAAIAPQPALTVRLVDPRISARADARSPSAAASAPPPLLLFSRFLI